MNSIEFNVTSKPTVMQLRNAILKIRDFVSSSNETNFSNLEISFRIYFEAEEMPATKAEMPYL